MPDMTKLNALSMYAGGQRAIGDAQVLRTKFNKMSPREQVSNWSLKTFPNAWESTGKFQKQQALKLYPALEQDIASFEKSLVKPNKLKNFFSKLLKIIKH